MQALKAPVGLDPTLDFVAGTISGIAGLLVGHPLDTVKVRFQNPQTSQRYGSTLNALTTIVREERFIGLYKGITSLLLTIGFLNGLVFSSYKFFLKLQLDDRDAIPTLIQITLAGACSGIVASVITTPAELIKIRQQSSLTPTSTYGVARQIFIDAGIAGLYHGWIATILRDIGYGVNFLSYEATLRMLASQTSGRGLPGPGDNRGPASVPLFLIAGGVAGIMGWLATYPFDVVKTRIQSSGGTNNPELPTQHTPLLSSQPEKNPYRSTFSTIIYSYQTEGISVFFQGLTPTIIQAIPVTMVTFAVFETFVRAFS